MSIDIDSLSYEELLELQHLISQKLKSIESGQPPKQNWKFNQGDKVSFSHPTLGTQTGTLLNYREKTVTVITRNGQKWDVSPHLLRKVIPHDHQRRRLHNIKNPSKK